MDMRTLTPEELDELRIEVATEIERRANLEAIPVEVAALANKYSTGGGDTEDLIRAINGDD